MDNYATSEYKITYLMGAGASAKALPIVKATQEAQGIKEALNTYAIFLEGRVGQLSLTSESTNFITGLISDLKLLSEQTGLFGTPDTYAKYLFLKEPEKLKVLKRALTFFFISRQFVDKRLDDRILIFLTSVLQYQNIFPSNIKILNWNYDLQIQLASENFSIEEFQIRDVFVHKPGLLNYYPGMGPEFNINYEEQDSSTISMVHLNGIAGLNFHQEMGIFQNEFLIDKPKNLKNLIERFEKLTAQNHDLITFAWESGNVVSRALRRRMEIAKNIVQGTDILVIIGYSFPFFNRAIDKQIFDAIKEKNRLKKIVYQDPVRTGEFLRPQFDLQNNLIIEHYPYTDNYFIPHEL